MPSDRPSFSALPDPDDRGPGGKPSEGGERGPELRGDGGRAPLSPLVPEEALPRIAADDAETGLEQHASFAGDAAVSRAVARARAVAEWLTELPSVEAPRELEGFVVAAMNPGERQARAARALAALQPMVAPEALASVVAAQILRSDPQERDAGPDRAPVQLDELVERRVVEPEATLVQGMASRLDAVHAPSELEARLQRELLAARAGQRSAGPDKSIARPGALVAAVLAAAAGVFLMALGGFSWLGGSGLSGQGLDPGEAAVQSPGQSIGQPSGLSAARSVVASVESSTPGERLMASASGSRFRVVRVTPDSMTESDRAVLGALGLSMGGS